MGGPFAADFRICEAVPIGESGVSRMLDVRPARHSEPHGETIHDHVHRHAARNREAVAILAPGRAPLDYGRLDTQIIYVGERLRLANIQASDRVAVVMSTGAEAAVVILSVAANAVCAPLNPACSSREFEFYLSALRAKALLVPHGASSAAIAAARLLEIRILHFMPETTSPAGIFSLMGKPDKSRTSEESASQDNPALLLFTSGTTARPKLVPLTHRQLRLSAENICSALQLDPADRCLGVMPLFHIHGLSTLFATLVSGGSYVGMSNFSLDSFFAGLGELHPTWYSASPAIHRAILDCAQSYRGSLATSGLRFIRSASAPIPEQLIADIESAFGVPLIEAYGMTEAAPQIASNRLPPFKRKPGSVGAAAGPEVAIMDEAERILRAGETGEVVIRGPNVIDGYDSDAVADAEAFAGGWLRTGDLGHLDADGYLFLTGRLNEVINRGGEKVPPQLVEQVLLEHPAIAEAVVFGIPHPVLGETVAAAIVLKPGNDPGPSVQQVRDFAAERLARFEVPQRIVVVDRIPLGSTGKLARKDLMRALGLGESGGRGRPSPIPTPTPRTATERRVAEVFAEVLKTDPPGIHDDFFALGGHSLAAMQVLARLQQIFQTALPVDALFLSPTVARLAERIGEQMANLVAEGTARLEQRPASAGDTNGADEPIPLRDDSEPAPLSFAQQRVYFLDQMGAAAAYNMSASLWLTGHVDERALAQSLGAIQSRHDILRTVFRMSGEQIVQVVLPPHHTDLAAIDLTAHPVAEREAEATRLVIEEARRPFDVARGPLFRAKLIRIGEEEAVLLLTMHHMVSDGWSMGVLYRELRQFYAAFRAGEASPLGDLPVQYGDYAAWQQRSFEGGRYDKQLAYWTRQLDGLPSACTFPADRPRPALQSYRGAIEQTFIDGQLIERLKAFSARENVTLFMTVLAAFKTQLFRYNGQEDCVVGVPIASRPKKELESLIGFFANTLVLRTSLAGDPSFVELLARVRSTALGAFAHGDMPFERVMQKMKVERDVGRTPLFQVMFAFQNFPETEGATSAVDPFARPSFGLADGLDAHPIRVDNKTAKFDLTLYLSETDRGMSVTWQFNTDLFDPATIYRFASQFQTLLEGIVTDPTQKVSELPLLSGADSHRIEIDWNRTEAPGLLQGNFIQLFEAQAARTPNDTAVLGVDRQFTYAELNERANQLARYFRSLGVGQDTVTGVCLPREADTLAVLLAVWKAGGAFLSLDPDHPPERIALMLRDSGAALLIVESALMPKLTSAVEAVGLGPGVPEIVCIDARQALVAAQSAENPGAVPQPDSLAYVIYTSGSTGKPKGVMITHGNVRHYAQAMAQAVSIRSEDRYLHSAPFSFSSSVRQLIVPLASGAAVAVATAEELRDPQALFETIRRHNISVLDFVPSFSVDCLHALMSLDAPARARLLDNNVRLMLSASEPLPAALIEGWRRLGRPDTAFVNMFGQTETTGIVLTYPIPNSDDRAAAIVPLGRPIANTQAYVLDASRRLVPVGICGELYIGGAGVGRGYVNEPEQTERSFVPNPFGRGEGERLYRTGDLARYRSDGVIEFVGRTDEQIKIRGVRIEPGEIEAVIRTFPGLRECVVSGAEDVAEPDRIGRGKFLAAFVVADAAGVADSSFATGLRGFLAGKLPDHMLPQRIVTLDRLPRTPNGKIDHQALLSMLQPPAIASRGVAKSLPQTETAPPADAERLLAEIWKKVLHLDRVSPGDNFFDLGGNSKLSLNVVFAAKQAGLRLELSQLYQHQTIAELARVVGETWPVAAVAADVARAAPAREAEAGILVTVASLRAFGREALLQAGLDPVGAEIVTEVQLEASLRGQLTHDMVSIPRYATRIASGKINPTPRIRIERETETTARIDGDNGPGQWISMVAMDVAMRKAREMGVGIVSVRHSNHFGAGGHYAWEATKQRLIGLCTTNGPLILAPTGGVTPTFGNNPLAIGIPAGCHMPILLDIAMSVAPRGKIGLAVAEGKPLPPGWILDRFGQPSTDLADLAAGLGVPIGGHKGYGLALVLEVLAGALSGAGFAADHSRDRLHGSSAPPDYGHMFIAINPERFMPASEFAARVDRLIDETKNGERAPHAQEILIPGEKELRTRDRSLKQGVRLLPSTYRALVTYGRDKRLGMTLDVV
jgi:amino acid adenylation domain-containing protein